MELGFKGCVVSSGAYRAQATCLHSCQLLCLTAQHFCSFFHPAASRLAARRLHLLKLLLRRVQLSLRGWLTV